MRSCSDYALRRVDGGCMFSSIRVVEARYVNVCTSGAYCYRGNSRSRAEWPLLGQCESKGELLVHSQFM